MRTWRERIVDGALKTDAYRNMLRGGSSDARAIGYAVRCMAEDAADDVQRELDADCDPVALAQGQGRLALLTAYLTFDSVLVPGMTCDEFAEVFRSRMPHSPGERLELVREGLRHGLISEAQGKRLLESNQL